MRCETRQLSVVEPPKKLCIWLTMPSNSAVVLGEKPRSCSAPLRRFGVPEDSAVLDQVVERRGIEPRFSHNLVEIRPQTKEAVFDVTLETYDGYTCCPLITGYNYTMMAEFDYDNRPVGNFLMNPAKERWSM